MEKAAQNETVEQESPKPTVSLSGGPYRLHILLKQGRELAAKDTCGTHLPIENLPIEDLTISVFVLR